MEFLLPQFLSLNKSLAEQEYILGLCEQFTKSYEAESYHSALFTYHLLFICYLYETIYKLKIWMPDEYYLAMVSMYPEKRILFREALSPMSYVHRDNKEKSLFEFLNVFTECEALVSRCKKLVDNRNEELGHVNYLLVDEGKFEKIISDYNLCINDISRLYENKLSSVVKSWVEELETEKEIEVNQELVELGLIAENRLSLVDLRSIHILCKLQNQDKYNKLSDILLNEYSVTEV